MQREVSWQLVLADLALILFVCTLAGLVGANNARENRECRTIFANSQSIYSNTPIKTGFGDWLAMQEPDDRAQLTIFGIYRNGESARIHQSVSMLENEAIAAGARPRLVIEEGNANQVFASLAYDGDLMNANDCM